jgi:adenylylsulfate kinase-like enzyme
VSWAVWFTGRPAAGKTTLARALKELAADRGVAIIHLESDSLRRILTPKPTYAPEERDRFYEIVAGLAALLTEQDFPVIVDATAPRRAHRERARRLIPRFLEVLVDTPPELCERRDPKGLYRAARRGEAPHLPGTGEPYEEPDRPDLVVSGASSPGEAIGSLWRLLQERGFL